MKTKIKYIEQVVLRSLTIILLLLLAGCSQQNTQENFEEDNEQQTTNTQNNGDEGTEKSIPEPKPQLKIGVISTNTGTFKPFNEDILYGYNNIIDQVNTNGGINDRPVLLVEKTGSCSSRFGMEAARNLIKLDKVQVILGAGCGEAVKFAAREAQNNGITMLNVGSGLPEIAKMGDYIFNYRSKTAQSYAILQYLQRNNFNSLAVLYPGDEQGYLLAEHLLDGFKGEVLLNQKYSPTDPDFANLGERIVDIINEFDRLVVFSSSDEIFMDLVAAFDSQSAWNPIRKRLVGDSIVTTQSVIDQLNEKVDGVMGLSSIDIGERVTQNGTALFDGYEVKVDDSLVVFAGDAASMIIDAVQADPMKEDELSSDTIQEYLAGITKTNKRNKYIRGFHFMESGDGVGIPYNLVKIENGSIVPLQ